jgi:hypothetical protein
LVSSRFSSEDIMTITTATDPDVDPAELVPDAAAAGALHQQRSTLASWRATGRGPRFYKIGRSVFYDPRDLREWLAAQRQHPRSRRERETDSSNAA